MSRLIDADKTLEWVDCMKPIHGIGLEPVVAVETVRDLIKGAPTIDAIPMWWITEKFLDVLNKDKELSKAAWLVRKAWIAEQEAQK